MEVTGKIQTIKNLTTKATQKRFRVLILEGDKAEYSCWKNTLEFTEGNRYKLLIEPNGKYLNVVGAAPASNDPFAEDGGDGREPEVGASTCKCPNCGYALTVS